MANYPKELIDLLQQYMTDGNITEKERAVLLRKAEAMNVDKDEFDLYIDAEIQKIDQKADAIKRQSKGKVCPFCEASIPTLADKCPECGANITPSATKELEEIIEKLEDALVNFKSGNDIEKSKAEVERYVRKANLYYGNNTKIKKLLEEVESEKIKAQAKAQRIARNRNIVNVLTYNKKLTAIVLIVIIFGIYSGVNSLLAPPDSPDYKNTAVAMKLIEDAIKEGDLSKAEFIYTEHGRGWGCASDLEPVLIKLARAHIENGNYSEAISLQEEMRSSNWWEFADPLSLAVQNGLIKAGQYEEAERLFRYFDPDPLLSNPMGTDVYYSFLLKCIDQMKINEDSKSKIKAFIDQKSIFYQQKRNGEIEIRDFVGEWKYSAVKKRLYDYAGV